MIQKGKDYEVSWSQFETCNANLQISFENMCRWLFNNFFFEGKALLHSNPNNPGIEVLPRLHEKTNKRISFQAKYFSVIDYEQIKHSAKAAVKYYAGQLDVIYLYCNKDVTTTSKPYQDIEKFLGENGIEIVPITNQAIIEQVMGNETIAWNYFNYVSLSKTWFQEQLKVGLASLGPRYNDEFNVPTYTENLLNYFLCNAPAIEAINIRKKEVLEEYRINRGKYRKYSGIGRRIVSVIEKIEDISSDNVLDCINWERYVRERSQKEISQLCDMLEDCKNRYNSATYSNDGKAVQELLNERAEIEYLLDLPRRIMPKDKELRLLQRQVVVVKGEAGVGKSQLFAVSVEKSLESGWYAVLMLGTHYITNMPINSQIPEILGGNLTLDALLHKLEAIGVQQNRHVSILIDAINESTYKDIWKVGLLPFINQIKQYPHIKLAISVRDGYEKLVFSDSMLHEISVGNIEQIIHKGFREESVEATKMFLNYYGIPFAPSYFLQAEMTNPLFLTLFCKNHTGDDYDLYSLFEHLMERADEEAQKAVEISGSFSLLQHLVDEIVDICLEKGTYSVTQQELFELCFWNRYGLESKKLAYVAALVRSGFLISMAMEYTESYSFGYNLLQDFVCAKKIIRLYPEKETLISYIQSHLLKIEEGRIVNYHNIDIFIVVCGLYAEKYHEECFPDIEQCVLDEYDKTDIIDRYVMSFLWRKASSVNKESFMDFINSHFVDRDLVFRVLIENSTKEKHPLNAMLLHEILMRKKIASRDVLWTTYINDFASEEERLVQLIMFLDKGNMLDGLTVANAELLLLLLCWLFTSSSRVLRDKASKAAIELLRCNFQLCEIMLRHFEKVDDPYVIQRLYGVVLGACLKRVKKDKTVYRKLAEYTYQNIFAQEKVYPDILLRDYARLILERWIYECPDDCEFISKSKVEPPYNSDDIPTVEHQEYYVSGLSKSGYNRIDHSMRINHSECPGLYGDFGRYTFQAALDDFDGVDIVNLYHYAMQFIRDELGYTDDLFGDYDCRSHNNYYSRHDVRKIERIGKKYQWIVFYNFLARVSDKYKIKNWGAESTQYEGAWEPYVRDFDPTFNKNTWSKIQLPSLFLPVEEDEFLDVGQEVKVDDIHEWKYVEPKRFALLPERLMVDDEDGNTWFGLYLYDSRKNKLHDLNDHSIGFAKGSQQIWTISEAFFVKEEQYDVLKENRELLSKSERFLLDGKDIYQLFNREYAWSPGYNSVFYQEWEEYKIETGRYRIETEVIEMPDFENVQKDKNDPWFIPMVKKEFERKIPKEEICIDVLPAYSRVLWEEEYDASQDEVTAFNIPCGDIIRYLKLEQREVDGCYYSEDGTLVTFDGIIGGLSGGLFIRKDYLEQYLEGNHFHLCWKCVGEKQFFNGDYNQIWSRWNGIYFYESGRVQGRLISDEKVEGIADEE